MRQDTSPEVARRYQAYLAAVTPAQKLAIAASLSSGTRTLAEAGLRHRHPEASADELRRRLAALLYGRALATRALGSIPDDA